MKTNWMLKCIGWALLGTLCVLGAGYAVMLLWNWLMPAVFGLNTITYWPALGILVLSKILFGGFRGRWGGHCGCGGGRHHYWREKWEAKMAGMTPEEREKFKEQFRHKYGRCGWGDWEEKEAEK